MKILREGTSFKPIEVSCLKCNAVIEADKPEDFVRDRGGDQRDYWDHALLTCPCCGNGIAVPKNRFPIHVYERFRESK